MGTTTADFELTDDELRAVARFAAEAAAGLLPRFEALVPGDSRPREAVDAAWSFVDGARRTQVQRAASFAAHRAAREVSNEVARLAAQSAGDAAAAAYLHPLAKAHQVGHILRAPANAARIAEIDAADRDVGRAALIEISERADPVVIDVLCRYPTPPAGRNRAAELMAALDALLRSRAFTS